MKITVLSENTAVLPFLSEHGLSLYIETEDKKLLFDTGQGDVIFENAETAGIDLKKVDFAIISHGHYDHGGGLAEFLKTNKTAKVYINENAFGNFFNAENKFIGLNKKLKESNRMVFTSDEFKLSENLTLFTANKNSRPYFTESFGLKENNLPDLFLHEQYLLVNENGKRILISGCSHKGIKNIIHWVNPVDFCVGGFHFIKTENEDFILSAAEKLSRTNTIFYTCHCTGEKQYNIMKKVMKDRLIYIRAGQKIEF